MKPIFVRKGPESIVFWCVLCWYNICQWHPLVLVAMASPWLICRCIAWMVKDSPSRSLLAPLAGKCGRWSQRSFQSQAPGLRCIMVLQSSFCGKAWKSKA
jgi:hypothetical protein